MCMHVCACMRTWTHTQNQQCKYEGWKESNASYFFLRTIITIIMKFTHIMGTSFMKLRLFFHKVSSFIINIIFPPLLEMHYASHIKLCAEELRGLSPMSFSLLLKQLIQHLTELTPMASSPQTLLRCLWICNQLEPCAISNSITTLCLVHTTTTSAILHRYSVKSKQVPGASMILVELDSVDIWWTRQQTLPSAKFKRKKIWGITFVVTFVWHRYCLFALTIMHV
jgi:hypothetical protein